MSPVLAIHSIGHVQSSPQSSPEKLCDACIKQICLHQKVFYACTKKTFHSIHSIKPMGTTFIQSIQSFIHAPVHPLTHSIHSLVRSSPTRSSTSTVCVPFIPCMPFIPCVPLIPYTSLMHSFIQSTPAIPCISLTLCISFIH